VVLWLPTLVYVPALQGAKQPVFAPVFTVFSLMMLAGLGAIVVGVVLLLPRLDTRARLVSVNLIVIGAGLALVGGILHYTRDSVHLLEIPVLFDPYPALVTYLGIFLAGAMFLAIGLFISSLLRDQMASVVLTLGAVLVFMVAGFIWPETDGSYLDRLVYFFSVPLHFDRAFTRGLIDTRPVILYCSVTIFCLFITVRSLEARRWQ
jgi:hypothetical protein